LLSWRFMRDVNVGIVGLGNVGSGSLTILTANSGEIARKLGFRLNVRGLCSRTIRTKSLPAGVGEVFTTTDWFELVTHPDIDIVAELVGGTTVAHQVVDEAIRHGKSVVTANKELMADCGLEIWSAASQAGVHLAFEASVCGGIPIHHVLRDGIAADRIQTLFGILNGTCNYILTEIERRQAKFDDVLREAQALGYAEADPTADVEGYDARSKLALLATLAFGQRTRVADIYTEGIRRISPEDFEYAAQLGYTIRLLCGARRSADGIRVSVRPALIPKDAILASVHGGYNAVWVRGAHGQDTFYYGKGAGPEPTGVAVVSDMMRLARDVRERRCQLSSPFAYQTLEPARILPIEDERKPWFLRFRVKDRPGIIAALATTLAEWAVSVDAVLQLPAKDKQNLPFVITVEAAPEHAIRAAVRKMGDYDFMADAPLALPMETGV